MDIDEPGKSILAFAEAWHNGGNMDTEQRRRVGRSKSGGLHRWNDDGQALVAAALLPK